MSDHGHDDDYEVGYGKPPKSKQFKKGQSGNPKGRKPRITNVSTLLSMELDRLIVVRDGEAEKQISKREALVTSLVNDAITGKATARQLLIKVLDVSPPAEPFVSNDDDQVAIDAFLARAQQRGRNNGDGGESDGEAA